MVSVRTILLPLAAIVALSGCCKKGQKGRGSDPGPGPAGPGARAHGARSSDPEAAGAPAVNAPEPAAGKGSVAGTVLHGGAPVAGVKVSLCTQFQSIGGGGCQGQIFTAVTDASGNYVVADVPPGKYAALTVDVFDTGRYIYTEEGIMRARSYTVAAGKVTQAGATQLYKSDLRATSPRLSARVAEAQPKITWEPYPGARSYKVSVRPGEPAGAASSVSGDSATTEWTPPQPLAPGRYFLSITAHDAERGRKLAELPDERMFVVAAPGTAVAPLPPAETPAAPAPMPPLDPFKASGNGGAVQGQVAFNEAPAAAIDVTLCEKYNRFSGCSGKSWKTKTDARGAYLFKDIPPATYEGLTARVFKTNMEVFLSGGGFGLQTKTYQVKAGETLTVSVTNLFKNDLKVTAPTENQKLKTGTPTLTWARYPGAATYEISIYGEAGADAKGYHRIRVDAPTFTLDQPLAPGKYRLEVAAHNVNGRKLSTAGSVHFEVVP